MERSRTHNSIRNASINLIAKLVSMICGFVIRTIFLKYLGEQYTGVSTLFTDILNFLSFTELGLGTAVSFSLYKPIAEHDDYRIAQLMKLYKYLYFAISGVVLILGLALVPFLDFFVKEVPDIKESITVIYIMYVLKTSFSYLMVYKSTFVIAEQKQYVVTGIECIGTAIKTVVDVIILVTTKNFMLYLLLEIVRVIITNIIISVYSNRDIKKIDGEIKVEKSDARALFKDVKDVFCYKVSGIILNSTDSMVLSRFVNITSVALLSNYNLIINAINSIVYQITSAMTASVGNMAIEKSNDEQKRVFSTINLLSFAFSSIECCGLWLCINPFVTLLWGENYVLNMPTVVLLCMNSFIINMHLAVDMFRTANGIFHKGRWRPLFTAVINLVVSIIAVQCWGIFGVLLGTVVSRVTTQVWYDAKLVFNTVFKCSVKNYYFKYMFYFLLILVECFAGTMIISLLPQNSLLRFGVGAICAILLSGMLIVLCFRKTEEFNNVKHYFSMFIEKFRR